MACNGCTAFRSTRRRDGRLPDQSILGRGFEASTVTARTMRWSPVLMLLLYCTETTSQNHGQPHTRPNAATLQRAQQKATLSPRSCSGPWLGHVRVFELQLDGSTRPLASAFEPCACGTQRMDSRGERGATKWICKIFTDPKVRRMYSCMAEPRRCEV